MNRDLELAIGNLYQKVDYTRFLSREFSDLISLGLQVIWFCEGGMISSQKAALMSNRSGVASVFYSGGLRDLNYRRSYEPTVYKTIRRQIEKVPYAAILQSYDMAIANHSELISGNDGISNFSFEPSGYARLVSQILQ